MGLDGQGLHHEWAFGWSKEQGRITMKSAIPSNEIRLAKVFI